MNKYRQSCVKKAQTLFQDVRGLFLEDSWVIARNFDKSQKLMSSLKIRKSSVFLNFHLNI